MKTKNSSMDFIYYRFRIADPNYLIKGLYLPFSHIDSSIYIIKYFRPIRKIEYVTSKIVRTWNTNYYHQLINLLKINIIAQSHVQKYLRGI